MLHTINRVSPLCIVTDCNAFVLINVYFREKDTEYSVNKENKRNNEDTEEIMRIYLK